MIVHVCTGTLFDLTMYLAKKEHLKKVFCMFNLQGSYLINLNLMSNKVI